VRSTRLYLGPLLSACLLAVACEPSSITAAHDQLQRGAQHTTRLTIPISQDTFSIAQFLPASDTATINGLMGLRLSPDSVNVDVGSHLQFTNLAFSPFNYSFAQMLQTQQISSGSITFPAPPAFPAAPVPGFPVTLPPRTHFSTPGGSTLVSATVSAGYVVRTMTNSTNCPAATLSITLKDTTGATILSFPAAAAPVTDSVTGAGASVVGGVDVTGTSNFGGCVPSSGTFSASLTFRPLTLSSVTLQNVNEGFTQTYNPLAGETRINAVDTVFVNTGSFSLTLQNRLPIADTLTVTLNGITKGGVTVSGMLAVPAAPGNGATTSGTLVLDLAGARILPAQVVAQVVGKAKQAAQATITSTNSTNAAVVSGGGTLSIQSLSGLLDPGVTPELNVPVQNFQEVASGSVNFGDLQQAVKLATLNNASAILTVSNASQIPMVLSNFSLGLVQVNSSGQLIRDGGGNLVFEKDASGSPILTSIVNPGLTTFTAARAATSSVTLNAGPLIDRVVHLVLNNQRVAMVTTGTASAGDGARSRITSTDVVKVRFQLLVGLDITVPTTGILFTRNQTTDGLNVDSVRANDLTSRIVQATAGARVTNATPFGMVVQLALVTDSVGPNVDVFALPGRVLLDSVVLPAPTVDANGLATTPAIDSVSVSITGANARLLFNKKFSVGAHIRLLPGTGAAGRGAVRPTDRIFISSKALVDVKSGSGS
jgi:hypothetical protein